MIQIAGIENMSMVDYDDKIACTIFTHGCNFRCPFCQNSALVLSDSIPLLDANKILEQLEKRKGLLDAVCISGGEATLQQDLVPFIKKIRSLGFLVKIDSNGYNPPMLKYLIEHKLVDYIAMDVKGSAEIYADICGLKQINMIKIKESVSIIMESKINYEFRTTLIEEFHTPEVMKNLLSMIKGSEKYALQKYKDSPGCIQHGFHPIPKDTALLYKQLAEKTVKQVIMRGY